MVSAGISYSSSAAGGRIGTSIGDGGGDGVDKRIGVPDGRSGAEVGEIGSSVCKERSTPTRWQ